MNYENWVFGKDGALLSACAQGNTALVRDLLKDGASPDITSPSGFTALHRAAENGHEAIVDLLLEQDAIVATEAANGDTPISAAHAKGHESIAKKLEARLEK